MKAMVVTACWLGLSFLSAILACLASGAIHPVFLAVGTAVFMGLYSPILIER